MRSFCATSGRRFFRALTVFFSGAGYIQMSFAPYITTTACKKLSRRWEAGRRYPRLRVDHRYPRRHYRCLLRQHKVSTESSAWFLGVELELLDAKPFKHINNPVSADLFHLLHKARLRSTRLKPTTAFRSYRFVWFHGPCFLGGKW